MAREKKALVRNAASPEQVKAARETEQFMEDTKQNDWLVVLATAEGRRVMWRVLDMCATRKSIFATDHGTISYRSGWQDAGHYIEAQINEADPRAFLRMIEEANRIEVNRVEPDATDEDT